MYHANSSPAWLPPPQPGDGPYQQHHAYHYGQDASAAASQTLVAYQPSPPQMAGQWGAQQPPAPPQALHHWGPPPSPSPPMQVVVHQEQQPQQPSPQGFNARVNGALRKPGKLASQSLGSINESYKQKKQLASQSVTNLNDGLQRRQKMASRSVSNLQDRGNQYMAHTVALCDLISSKLDQIITSIDDEVFSGNEQELVIYEHPPEPHQSSLDVSKGNNQNIAAVASYSNHFSKVWLYANSRLPPHLPPLKVYMPTWPLLCLAAQYSEKVYHKPAPGDAEADESETHVEPDWRQGTKAMVIKSVPVDDMNTIVFAIRGSAGFMDWAVNFRPAPTTPKGFLDDEGNLVHSGFLYVARKMVAPVAARLQSLLRKNPKRATCSLLITGHSAGGAVASLLYAHMMSTTVSSELNQLTQLFKRVHCVTFGAPPVSLLPLRKPENPADRKWKKSLFFGFINEGDPVVRADKDVIKNMLRLYATPAPRTAAPPNSNSCALTSMSSLALASSTSLLPGSNSGKKQQKKKTKSNSWSSASGGSTNPSKPPPPTWNVPPGVLSCAGRLILLRDRPGASNPPNPLGELNVEACTVADEELRAAVFGDPMCHMMKLYARRIEVLATRAVTAGGMDLR
ncbi:Lipase class 3 [Lasiodiplodia theobromae]|uniref:Lipase class 3 n=1 Tax=Lasiodiplodia theobromae TaxID=45133 RepID=UPI0015C2CDD9|nr:Lipase class 3 [Lasiodiplodia theobromae]KAF4538784.1 Lipase class 3 [Lasiodiplodia theobromae]